MRHALRWLTARPVLVATAVLSIALGAGANTAIFTFAHALLLAPLPVRAPEQLVVLETPNPRHWGVVHGFSNYAFSYPMYKDVRDSATVFSGVACRAALPLSLQSGGNAERVAGELVSGNFFAVAGVEPRLGRLLTPHDESSPQVAVLSHGYWVRRFGADSGVLGQEMRLNGHAITIVGVAAPGFRGFEPGAAQEIFVPVTMAPALLPSPDRLPLRERNWVHIIGRLKPGIAPSEAQAIMSVLHRQLLAKDWGFADPRSSPEMKERFFAQNIRLQSAGSGYGKMRYTARQPLLLLSAVVGMVLLIACANVANLLLAQSVARRREIGVRLALGASRWRLVRQLLCESLMLSLAGAAGGLLLAFWSLDLLAGMFPVTAGAGASPAVFGFTLALALVTGVLFGLAPALQLTGSAVADDLRGARTTAAAVVRNRWSMGGLLVVAQVSLSLLLTVGAALFLQTLRNLRGVDVGFDRQQILVASLDPGLNGYSGERSQAFYSELLDRVRSLPQVRSAAIGKVALLTGDTWSGRMNAEGHHPDSNEQRFAYLNFVSEGFFETLGIPLVWGRYTSESDTRTAVINESAARRFFGTANPLGRRIALGVLNPPDTEIVGVVRDTRYAGVKEEPQPIVYFTSRSQKDPRAMILHARVTGDASSVATALRGIVRDLDPDLPLYGLRTFEDHVDEALLFERLLALLTTVFGVVAAVLAGVGVYGVFSNRVARRTREIGICIALGAHNGAILRSVLADTLRLSLAGVAAGLLGIALLARYVEHMLFGIRPAHPGLVAAAVAGMLALSLLASFVPALRAARVDPMRAIASE